ncbi:MAG: DUF2007 domain-containing protein [Saprospiraceae bacterium]|nr:DUF2007 domain-containing protein [Saprospiraceae bacterium]MBK6478545.1 DUF2007 domain-containing protein [Saprospiraceae bacterium]MBK6814040.1 DUF2007 domain-containing protein [Saprospiraceae bacterium]MBK7373480.1 DUF2007 domain-containing protein [Saprospiraceae bacterium]MBK7437151.1 DUF2007 domain-containing protein [Saprospiraceae bacterium]
MRRIEIWSSPFMLEAEHIYEILVSHGIPAQLLNQKDSAYVLLGEARVLIPEQLEEEARKLLTINGYLQDRQFLN